VKAERVKVSGESHCSQGETPANQKT
jgi:hypothetical protein